MWVVRPERFELPTSWFVARRSIQLSYGRKEKSTKTPSPIAPECADIAFNEQWPAPWAGSTSGRFPPVKPSRPRQGREYYHIDCRAPFGRRAAVYQGSWVPDFSLTGTECSGDARSRPI